MRFQVKKVTPAAAEVMLASNQTNRTLRPAVVERYARDMSAGRWMPNGEPIKFSMTKRLLDGQHRLQAVIASGVTVEFLVVEGLADDVFPTLDTGRSRTRADVLSTAWAPRPADLAATLLKIHSIKTGGNLTVSRQGGVTNADVLALWDKYGDLTESIRVGDRGRHLLPHSIGAALHYLMSEVSPEDADNFFGGIIGGQELGSNSPIYQLRDRLIRNAAAAGTKLTPKTIAALVIKAWNLYRVGASHGRGLYYRDGGENPEAFPAISGAS